MYGLHTSTKLTTEDHTDLLFPKVAIYIRRVAPPRGEFRDETHPHRAELTPAPGGITLSCIEGELGADFTSLGMS